MATQSILFSSAAATPTASLFEPHSDTLVQASVIVSIDPGNWRADFTDVPQGMYRFEQVDPTDPANPVIEIAKHVFLKLDDGTYDGIQVTRLELRVYDEKVLLKPTAEFEIGMSQPPNGQDVYSRANFRVVSDADGLVSVWLVVGATYRLINRYPDICKDQPSYCEFTIPSNAGVPYQLT